MVIHIGAETQLPQILTRCGRLPAVIAEDGKRYRRGRIYCAPANCHLLIKDHTTVLIRGPRENGHRPAADVSVSERYARTSRKSYRRCDERRTRRRLGWSLRDQSARRHRHCPGSSRSANAKYAAKCARHGGHRFCLPVRQIPDILVELTNGEATNITEWPNGGTIMEDQATADHPTSEPPGNQIPVNCPECNGPLYEVKDGELANFECFVGHRFSPESLSEQHTEALERALWTAVRKLKERVVLHKALVERKKRNKGEEELRKRLEESASTSERDLKLLREIWSESSVADLRSARSSGAASLNAAERGDAPTPTSWRLAQNAPGLVHDHESLARAVTLARGEILGSSRRPPDSGQTLFNEIALHFPVFQR